LVDDTNRGAAVFIRAGVATGKSTLAVHLASKHSDRYILVATGETEADFRENIIRSAPGEIDPAGHSAIFHALRAMNDKTLIFDEAHRLFRYPELMSALLKLPAPGESPKYLLFSASANGDSDGVMTTSSPQIDRKFMWYPPLPDATVLSASLKEADVSLSIGSVDFFMKICGGHRGIFMSAVVWVKEQQQSQEQAEWSVAKSVTEVRASLAVSAKKESGGWNFGFLSAIAQSRAVRVNSKYSELHNIPVVFANVLAGGAKKLSELNNHHRLLTIAGFIVPQQLSADSGEFVKYDWIDSGVRYGVANSMMAQYYRDTFSSELNFQSQLIADMDAPTSCADLLARALPFMSFINVVDSPTTRDGDKQSPLSADLLPPEDHYNDAVADALKQLKFNVSKPLELAAGKVDVYVTLDNGVTFAIEPIMATRSPELHAQHVNRFRNPAKKTNYSQATHKCVVTIGLRSEGVTDPFERVKNTAANHGVDIIGLVVSQAHDSYTMYIKSASGGGVVQGPFFFACDHVAKSLKTTVHGELQVVSAQELKHTDNLPSADAFAQYPDAATMQVVVRAIAEKEGYSEEEVAPSLAILRSAMVKTAGNMRALSVEQIKELGLPPVVTAYMLRVKKGGK
jgi:hypothetical protein